MFKILSIDGGGIKGIIPCKILAHIEKRLGERSSRLFDLIAGSSTGGIIALGLGMPNKDDNAFSKYSAEDMLELYEEHGTAIFAKRKQSWFTDVLAQIPKVGQLVEKPFDESKLKDLLLKYFGDAQLSDQLINTLITTYDIEQEKSFYFLSRLAKDKNKSKENFLLREIARSTSAAPTYFEPSILPYDEEKDFAFVDGGVFANNPSILAYCEAKEIYKNRADMAFIPEILATDDDFPFFMLSIGTGYYREGISGKKARKYRSIKWLEPMLQNIFMDSVASNTEYIMPHLLPPFKNGNPRYLRLNVEIPKELTDMSNASRENIKGLCDIADKYIKENKEQLNKICDEYLNPYYNN